jgi:small subunit ribosomal protein S18
MKNLMNKKCFFCKTKVEPSFKEAETLKKFLSVRGKIVAREKSGICSWHQRKLSAEIKKARLLMLLPYVAYET